MKYSFLALIAVFFISCQNKNSETKTPEATVPIDYAAKNEAEIIKYIADNNLDAKRSDRGLYYVITDEGTGEKPTANSNVQVAYKGYFMDKKVFDQSNEEGISFGLNQVILGWTEGIQYFKEGGSGILLVPSQLGYGNADRGPIPGGSALIFEVKLIAVN